MGSREDDSSGSDDNSAEAILQRTLVELSAMHGIQSSEVMDRALEAALHLSDSSIGYLALYDDKAKRLSMHAWSALAMKECSITNAKTDYDLDATGLWGEAVRQRKAIITNDYPAASTLKKGLPAGHVRLRRHMNAPVFEEDRIVMVAGVGNKTTPYTEIDAKNLSLLMGEAWKIARHQEVELALQRSEERFRLMIKRSPIPILVADEKGRFEHLNDRFVALFGYTLQDLPDIATWWERAYPDPAYREEVKGVWRGRNFKEVDDRQYDDAREYRVTCKDGSILIAEIYANQIEDHFLYMFNDVTRRKRTEEAMLHLKEQYLQSQKMEAIGRLAGGVAHDFNNLLTAIIGYAELIGTEEGLTEAVGEGVDEIKKAARRAAGLTRQLLAFGRKQLLQIIPVELNALVSNLEKMLCRLIGEDLLLVCSLGASPSWVLVDPGQIEQVITNLAVNARDAMPQGGTLSITTTNLTITEGQSTPFPQAQPGSYILLSVSDTGVGMEESVRAHLFEPFFTTKEPGKGSGLGLSTVYGIVAQCGGHVSVSSTIGSGTRFDVCLPCTQPAAPTVDPADTTAPKGTETILLVEDEETLLEMTARMLSRSGYTVIKSSAPLEALGMVRRPDFPRVDLLLTDIVMPRMNGRELADAISAARPGIRILFMSGYTNDSAIRQGVLEQGLAFLQKPFTPDSLVRKVRETLDR